MAQILTICMRQVRFWEKPKNEISGLTFRLRFGLCFYNRTEILFLHIPRMHIYFRFKHMMIRANCESAAFYRCGHLELKKANKKLKALTSVQQRLNIRQYILNCTSCLLTGFLIFCVAFQFQFNWHIFCGHHR